MLGYQSLKEFYADIAETYLWQFCKKHDFDYDSIDVYFVGEDSYDIACVGDYFFNLTDIRYDIDNKLNRKVIFEWYDKCLNAHFEKKPVVNLTTFSKYGWIAK